MDMEKFEDWLDFEATPYEVAVLWFKIHEIEIRDQESEVKKLRQQSEETGFVRLSDWPKPF